MRSTVITTALAVIVVLLSFTATTFAASGAEVAGGSLLDLLRPVVDAAMGGQYMLAGALALVVAVAAMRQFAPWEWVKSEWGAPVLVLAGAFGTTLAGTIAAGATPTLETFKTALGVAVGAAGGWKIAKELIAPMLRKLRDKLPAKVQPLISVLLWVFEKPGAARIAAAEAAGAAAVKAHPAPGVEGVIGKVKDVR